MAVGAKPDVAAGWTTIGVHWVNNDHLNQRHGFAFRISGTAMPQALSSN
jgi:hypothetical protein